MEFREAPLRISHFSHGTNSSKTSKLEVNLPRGQYWPPGAEEALKSEMAVILQAIDEVFALDAEGSPIHKSDPSKEVIISRVAVDLCALGYAPALTEQTVAKLSEVIKNCARSLLVRSRTTNERIKVAAAAWSHFADATSFVRRTLLYPDQIYVGKVQHLKSWTHVCLDQYRNCLQGNNFDLIGYLINELCERLSSLRMADAEIVAETGDVPKTEEDKDADLRNIVHMLLDLQCYSSRLLPQLHEGLDKDCTTAFEKIMQSKHSKARQCAMLLATLLLREFQRGSFVFQHRTPPQLLTTIITNLFSGHLHVFFGSAEFDSVTFTAEIPVQVTPTSGLIELMLRREDSLLRLIFWASSLREHMTDFCNAWAEGVRQITIRFIDHFFPENRQMTENAKVEIFSCFIILSERLNWVTFKVFDSEIKSYKDATNDDVLDLKSCESISNMDLDHYLDFVVTLLMWLKLILATDTVKDRTLSETLQKRTREAFGAALAAKPEGARMLSTCLIQFVDQLLRGRRAMGAPDDEQAIKEVLRSVILVLRSIEWKNLIKTMHEEGMTMRLFAGQGKYHELERFFVSLLAEECGDAFTQDMQNILSEFDASNLITADFYEQLAGSADDCTYGISIVPAQVWKGAKSSNSPQNMGDAPTPRELVTYDFDCPLPPQIVSFNAQFATFYKKKFENRILKYALNDSRAQVKMNRPGKHPAFYLLTTTALQAILLLKFNERPQWTLSELATATKIDTDRIIQELNPLQADPTKAVLESSPQDPNSFTVNTNLTYSRTKISFRGFNALGDTDVREPTGKLLDKASQLSTAAIDAFIVRHLKMMKADTFANMFASLAEARLGAPLEPDQVRERLNMLVDKDFLSVDAADPNQYRYQS